VGRLVSYGRSAIGLFGPAVHAHSKRGGCEPLRRTVEGIKIENELKAGVGKVIGMAAQLGATVAAGEVLATIE
jgi:hypothetical protein